MNIQIQKWVDRWLGIPCCAALSAWHGTWNFFQYTPSVKPPPRRILVILLSELGSLILSEPMLCRLQKRYPDATLYMLLFARNRQVLDLLSFVQPEHILAVRDDSALHLLIDLWHSIRRMRTIGIDTVVDCELFARCSAIISGCSGALRRIGFHRHAQEGLYRGSFHTSPVPYNPYRHLSLQLISLADAIESGETPRAKSDLVTGPFAPPTFVPGLGEVKREMDQLYGDYPQIVGKKMVLLYPSGGLLPIRAWPLEYFVTVAQALLQDGCAIGVIGLPDDRTLAEALRSACGNNDSCINLAGYTRSIRHLLCIFERSDLLITNDGGPGQVAAMTHIPTIVFFGPETPLLYGSWSPFAHVFYTPLPCSPCLTAYNHRTSPCDGDNQCLKRIAPESVLAKAREFLIIR